MAQPSNQPFDNLAAPENEPSVDEAISESQAVVNVVSTRNPPGLLDLPSELRLMIFHHLLFDPDGLDLGLWARRPRPSLDVLQTSRLIHREAFDVLYGENRFSNCIGSTYRHLNSFPRIIDTIRNVHVDMPIYLKYVSTQNFLNYMHHFGKPSTTRDTLTVDIVFNSSSAPPLVEWRNPLKWLIRAMGRFANFRTIELHTDRYDGVRDCHLNVLNHLEVALEPVLGCSEYRIIDYKGLRFHPKDHQDRIKELNDGDWADTLDGIRLEWNEKVTNQDDSKTPGQN